MSAAPASAGADIVDRLRSRAWEHRCHREYRSEAADTIEALRAQVAMLKDRAADGAQPVAYMTKDKRMLHFADTHHAAGYSVWGLTPLYAGRPLPPKDAA